MGGGGGNLLNSPEIGENSDFEGVEDPKQDSGNTTWTEPTFKTYDDYFTDLNITAETITEQDLTGKGSASDPYVVHSTRGFLWLTGYEYSRIVAVAVYIELDCDIILNDETFDKNGTPSGGDGVIYSWYAFSTRFSHNYVYCNNFGIYGCYFNQEEQDCFAFFGKNSYVITDLSFSNFYVSVGSGEIFLLSKWINGQKAIMMENIVVKNGVLIGKEVFWTSTTTNVIDCVNYADMRATSSCAPFGNQLTNGNVIGCVNYGDIYLANGWAAGGIVAGAHGKSQIINCKNFGDIVCGQRHIGGIVGISYANAGHTIISNCENYGNITDTYNSVCGGIIGTAESKIDIINCKNYGKIKVTQSYGIGAMVGIAYAYVFDTEISIVGCYSYSEEKIYYIGQCIQQCFLKINIYDTQIEYDIKGEGLKNIMFPHNRYSIPFEFNMKNVKLKINQQQKSSFMLLSDIGNANNNRKIILRDILLESNVATTKQEYIQAYDFVDAERIVVCAGENKYFYGDNFSNFYVDWKSGKIGLKSMSGKGFYQGRVSEEWMIEKGFTKKAI